MRTVGNVVLLVVGCCQTKDWVSGSAVLFTTPVVAVDLRTSPSILATRGSIFATWPLRAASAIRSTFAPPAYWKMPCSESGLMMVRVEVLEPGELTHS